MTYVAVMIMVALVALFLRFSIEQLIIWNIAQGESNAQESLRLLSTALENYARDHQGVYPAMLSTLSESAPPYIGRGYTQMGVSRGYMFNCSVLDGGGYSCSAAPTRCKLTGTTVFRVTTGGSLSAEPCSTKE